MEEVGGNNRNRYDSRELRRVTLWIMVLNKNMKHFLNIGGMCLRKTSIVVNSGRILKDIVDVNCRLMFVMYPG